MASESDALAEAELREAKLLERLAAHPVVTISGVVGAVVRGSRPRGEGPWMQSFELEVWRDEAGELKTQPINILRRVSQEECERFRLSVPPDAILRIRARISGELADGMPQALLEEVIGPDDSDAELNEEAARLKKPVTCDDPVLGTMRLDRLINYFVAETMWDGTPVSVFLAARPQSDFPAALSTAHALWECQSVWSQRVRDFAVRALLPLKNDAWLGKGEIEVTADQFRDRMSIDSITVRPNGSFEFCYGDGNLFRGWCVIEVKGNLSDGPTEADTYPPDLKLPDGCDITEVVGVSASIRYRRSAVLAWLVRDWHWPAAALFAAVVLLLLVPVWLAVAGLPLTLVYLQLPIYMLHQWEEHQGDRFRLYINRTIGGGREALTPIATFWINALGVWVVDLVALYLACFVDLSFGLIAVYLPLVNSLGHIGPALARREYNPGLWTSLVLFVPVGGYAHYEIATASGATWVGHAIGAGVAVAVHVAIVVHVARRLAAKQGEPGA